METSNDGICYYFAYGSNMNPNRMTERGITFIKRELGELQGYALVFNKIVKSTGTAAANIIVDEKSIVYGALYTCADSHVLKQLDKYEGVASKQYYCTKCTVNLADKTSVAANVYIANQDACKTGLLIHPSYLEHLLDGRDILPPRYYDFLCSFKEQLKQDVSVYLYFAYGSDINPLVIQKRGIKFSRREPACLFDYKLCFNKIKSSSGLAVANIVPQKDSKVFGAVYKSYDFNPFENLDKCNGVETNHYIRKQVTIHLYDGRCVEANVYIANAAACKDNLDIDPDHFDNLMAGKDVLPLDYVEYLISCQKISHLL